MVESNQPAGGASDDPRRAAAEDQPTGSAPAERDVAFLEPPASDDGATAPARTAEPATAVQPTTAPPAPAEQQPVIAPAAEAAPEPPKQASNRVVATAWVLLGAGIFEALFFAINALVVLIFGGSQAVVGQLQAIAGTALAWLPVLLFFLFFELVVLLLPRAGRVFYVLASLVVAVVVYVLTVVLFLMITSGGLGDSNRLAQTALNWDFILVGLVAREAMLWTGLGIGSRGIRVRRRNKEARRRYAEDLADADARA